MKIGVSAFAWTGRLDSAHLALLPRIKDMGIEGFEVPLFDPATLAVEEIRSALEANQLECTVCAILPGGINPISPDRAVRRRSVEHLVRCVETAAALGSRILAGPLYAPIGYLPEHRPNAEEWSWAVEALQKLGDSLEANQVTLAIEPVNRSETFFLRTAKEAKSLCEAVGLPRIGVTIDTFHANIEEKNIAEAILSLGPLLRHLHASENDRGLLGKGHVDFPAVVAALDQIGYRGYLMIEGFGYSPAEKEGPGALWAELDVTPEEIALEGAQDLRRLL